jgi:uncharacterized protein (TIGR02246 family)
MFMTTSTLTSSVENLDSEAAAAVQVVSRVNAAWDRNDAEEFAAVYTEDATLILSGDRFFEGREHIARELALSFAGPHKGTRLIADVVSFHWIAPGLAAIVTEGGVVAPGEDTFVWDRALRATWVAARQEDGGYLVAAYQNGRRADGALKGEGEK